MPNCKNRTQCENAGGNIQISYGEVCIPSETTFCTNNTNSHGIVSSLYVQHPIVDEGKNHGIVNSSATLLVDGAWKNDVNHYALFVKGSSSVSKMEGYLDVDGGIQVKSTLVFAAGTNQSTAIILNPYESSVLVSLTSNGQGIKLPTGSPGKRISFIRENSTYFYHLYPGDKARINGKLPNAPLIVPVGGSITICMASSEMEWSCVIQSSSGGKIFTAITSNGNASLSGHVTLGDEVTDTISAKGPLTAHSSLEVESHSTLKGNVFMHGTVAIEDSDVILRSLSNIQAAKEFRFEKSRSMGGISVSEGDILGTLSWYGSNGTSSKLAATIRTEVDGPHTNENKNLPGRIIFATSSYNLQQEERLKLSSNTTVLTLPNNSRDAFALQVGNEHFPVISIDTLDMNATNNEATWGSRSLSFKSEGTSIVTNTFTISDTFEEQFSIRRQLESGTYSSKITFSATAEVRYNTPRLNFSNQPITMQLRPNDKRALEISDGAVAIFQISTNEDEEGQQIALTTDVVKLNSPTLDISSSPVTITVNNQSSNSLVIGDGVQSFLNISTNAEVEGAEHFTIASRGSFILNTPVMNIQKNDFLQLIKSKSPYSYRISTERQNFLSINTANKSVTFISNSFDVSSTLMNLAANYSIKIDSPVLDFSKNTMQFILKSEEAEAFSISDDTGTLLAKVDTDTGPHFPASTTLQTKLVVQVPDIQQLGVVSGYNMMKVATTTVDIKNVANPHLISSLFIDNVEMKGEALSSIGLSATLYIDGPSTLAAGQSPGAISGHNASTSKYALYIAGENANNQIIGKLFVKGGLYLGESNGTVAPTLLSADGLAKVSGTNSDKNDGSDKVVVTNANGEVRIHKLNVNPSNSNDGFLKIHDVAVVSSAADINMLSGLSSRSSYTDGQRPSISGRTLLFSDTDYRAQTFALQIWDNYYGYPDVEVKRLFANVTHTHSSSSSEFTISSTNGVVHVEQIRFHEREMSNVDKIELSTLSPMTFIGTNTNNFVVDIDLIEPSADRTITIPDSSGMVRLYSEESMATTPSEVQIGPYTTYVTLTVSNDNDVIVLPGSNSVQRGHSIDIYTTTGSGSKRFKMKAASTDGINGHSAGTNSKAIEVGLDGTLVSCKNLAPSGNHSWACTYIYGTRPNEIKMVSTGPIVDAVVSPDSLVAGEITSVVVNFTLIDAVPADGKILIDFPSGFDVVTSSVGHIGTPVGLDGSLSISGHGPTVTIIRQGDGTPTVGEVSIKLTNIKNPALSGTSGTFAITTKSSSEATIGTVMNVEGVSIAGGAIFDALVSPVSQRASFIGNMSINFTITNPLPGDAKIVIQFPDSFDRNLGGQTDIAAYSQILSGSLSVIVNERNVTITRSSGTELPSLGVVDDLVLTNIKNPELLGGSGTFQIVTLTSNNAIIDSVANIREFVVVNAFAIEPNGIENNNTDGTTINITFMLYASESIRCIVIRFADEEPNATFVYAGLNAEGANVSNSPVASQAYKSVQGVIMYGGLSNGTAYKIYCATESGIKSPPIPITPLARGFAKHPVVTEDANTDGTNLKVTFTTNVNADIRCHARVHGASPPTLMDIKTAVYAQGSPPATIVVAANVETTVTYGGLVAGTQYDVYCATLPGDESAVIGNVFMYTPSPAGFSSHAAVTESENTNGTVAIVTLSTFTSEKVRCVALNNGTNIPTAAQVMQGVDGDGSTAAGRAPSYATSTGGVPISIHYPGLSKNVQYDLYCATNRSVLGNRLDFALATAGFATQPTVSQEIHTYGTSINITMVTYSSEYVRCVALSDGQIEPNALQIYSGRNASDSIVTNSPAPKKFTLNVEQSIEYNSLQPGIVYNIYCATGGSLSTINDALLDSTLNSSDNMNASAYTNIPLVTTSGSVSGAKIGLTTNATHITSINVEYGGIGYREGDILKVLGSTLPGRESDIVFTLNRNDLKGGVVSTMAEARPMGNGFVRQPFASNINNTGFDISADPGGNVAIRCAVYNSGVMTPTADQVNAGTGRAICENSAFTTESACTQQGSWNVTSNSCNISSGGREVNSTTCTAPTSTWRNSNVGEINGPAVSVLDAGITDNGELHTFVYTNLLPNSTYEIFCATADSSATLSNVVIVRTPGMLIYESTSVVPQSLVAGTINNVTVSFTTINPIPVDGIIYVTFPPGFNFTDSVKAISSDIDGILAVNVDSRRIAISRSSGSIINAGTIIDDLTLSEIKNPTVSGSTGVFVVATTSSIISIPIDMRENVMSQSIDTGELSGVAVTPSSLRAGATTNALVTFTTSNGNPMPADGQIVVTFPPGFNLTEVTSVSSASDVNGILDIQSGINGQTITISRVIGGLKSTIDSLLSSTTGSKAAINPGTQLNLPITSVTGLGSGAFVSITSNSSAVTSINVTTPGQGYKVGDLVKISSTEIAGRSTDLEFTIHADNLEVPTSISGGSIIDDLFIQNIKNPQISGSTGTFTVKTATSAGTLIDVKENASSLTVTPGAIETVSISTTDREAGASQDIYFDFTVTNPIPADGKIIITFPTSNPPGSFDVSNVFLNSVNGLDGTFSTTSDNNNVTIVRSGGSTAPAGKAISSMILRNIVNPPKSATTGTFMITTQNGNGVEIDSNSAIAGFEILPGKLYRANEVSTNAPILDFSNLQQSTEASATLSFRTQNEIPASGKFHIIFPTGFTVTSLMIRSTELGVSNFQTTEVVYENGVALPRQRIRTAQSTIPGNSTINIEFKNIGLPATTSGGSAIKIKTRDSNSILIDENDIDHPVIQSTGTITSNALAISNLTAGGNPTVLNLTFILSTKIGKFNTITLTTSPGIFDVSGAINCVATVGGSSLPLTAAATSTTEITATLDGSAPASNLITLSFNSNLANNPASGTNVTYDLVVTGHTSLTSQFGYTIS